MLKPTKILLAAGLLFAASGLFAQDSKWTFSASFGQGRADIDKVKIMNQVGGITVTENSKDFAWSAGLGYTLNDRWALELQFVDPGDAVINGTLTGGLPWNARVSSSVWALGAVCNLPINDTYSFYLKAGPDSWAYIVRESANVNGNYDKDGFSFFGTVGFRATFSPAVSAHIEYSYLGGKNSYRTILAGVRFSL